MDTHDPASLPRYQLAARHGRWLKRLTVCVGLLVVALLAMIGSGFLPGWRPVAVTQAASLLVLMACLQSAWWISRWRVHALAVLPVMAANDMAAASVRTSEPSPEALPLLQRLRAGIIHYWSGLNAFTRYRHLASSLVSIFCSSAAILLVTRYWDGQPVIPEAVYTGQVPLSFLIAIGLGALAFILLVSERYFAGCAATDLPEAPAVTYILRVNITVSLILVTGVLLAGPARQWPVLLLVWAGAIPAAIAVEYLLRITLSAFAPPGLQEPRLITTSLLAALWNWPPAPLAQLQDELRQRFGIDLRQSWAFAYIRRALLPVGVSLAGIAWLFTGLVEVPTDGRGIYERFGAPVAVWQPGVHIGLPWPLGQVQWVENGVVHELSASIGDTVPDTASSRVLASAEGEPPVSANRLWDASHSAEKSQIIASEVMTSEGSRQSFQIVNMDVRFMYRIGLDDRAAINARYNTHDSAGLIRSSANRILVRYFASRTLEGVLGEARTPMAMDIGRQLQADLDELHSGIDIVATVLEAIHPPAAAANAYHAVQAARINAQAIIARERGSAAQQVNLAQLRAGIGRDQATAAARETLVTADVAWRRFTAERDAYRQGGKAFLQEHYFARLTEGLGKARLVLVDHRLPAASASIDLRDFSGAIDGAGIPATVSLVRKVDNQESP